MNKLEFIKKLSANSGVSQKDAKEILSAMVDLIKESLKNHEEIKLTGFGKFEVKNRAERVTINPLTKERMVIPSAKVATFRAGKELKDAVNE